MNFSVHGAKTQLSKLLDLVEDGELVVIERHGRPVAHLVPARRRRGSARCVGSSRWPRAGNVRSPMKKPKRSGLIAQAVAEGLDFVTNDEPISDYPVRTIW